MDEIPTLPVSIEMSLSPISQKTSRTIMIGYIVMPFTVLIIANIIYVIDVPAKEKNNHKS
jgi:hypothetical protein